MPDFKNIINKAQNSKFGLWKLNFLLLRFIPFNRPHRIRIKSLTRDRIEVSLPLIKNNKNHIKGLHACSMATAAEFSSGFLLMSKLDIKKYRLIMESIQVDYHYQGKSDATAIFWISEEEFQNKIVEVLIVEGKVSYTCSVELFDSQQKLLCTAKMNWQIKNWGKVKSNIGSSY